MLSEAEYKQEWLNGLHQTDYNNCRFAEDKTQYAIDWVKKNLPNVNLENPQTLVDRINYYKIFDKDKRKTFWADKIMVRYMIEDLDPMNEEGLHDILIPTIYSSRCYLFRYEYDNFIPDGKYIIKCNHGSGCNIRFEKKPGFDPTYMLSKIKEWYFLNYAYVSGYEWQYENIIVGIIVQPDYGQLKDWNFWCENGEIKYVQTVRKINKNLEDYLTFTDANGDKPDIYIGVKPLRFNLLESEKETLEKMKPIVKKLASDFKFVRVDLYSINGQVKFGETTFSPCSGKIPMFKV
jgi:hypothetical protein